MNPLMIEAGISVVKMAVDALSDYQAGRITDAELQARWSAMNARVEQANDAWESAG